MRMNPTAVAVLAMVLATATLSQGQCLTGSFTFEVDGACTAESVIEGYQDQVYGMAGSVPATCTTSAEDDLNAKLSAAGLTLQSLCDQVYLSQDKVPFTDAANRGADLHFESQFFNGRTDWQEEVETKYETEDGTATSVLKEDAEAVKAFYRGTAQGRRVEWPGTLNNFHSSVKDSDDLATCTTNAAMCCWPKDRQANDNNGNCATPYDQNCVNKDPADNTDLCFIDPARGNQSTGYESDEGVLVYPGDNNEGEGAIHCHGLAWSNDVNHHTARYKANNLFFVSMYDHMYQRGYVKNIPGAPMCACVEQMPTVSRSDCTQVDLTETIKITYDADTGAFDSRLTYVEVDFNACRGINNRNNDLWAYLGRLYYEGEITPQQFGEAGRIITNHGCEEATNFELNKKSLTPGHDHDIAEWTNVAGREAMRLQDHYGHRAFHRSLVPGTDHYGIMYRACQSCVRTHKKIYYRRVSPIPDELDLMHVVLYAHQQIDGNVWNVDFTLHSTFEDAVSGDNPWKCRNDSFNYGATFYGECSPDGTRVRNQYSRFNSDFHGKHNVGFYTYKAEEDGLEVIPTTAIKGREYADGIALKDPEDGGKIYMTGRGRDIWWLHDDFNYMSEEYEGDVTVVVHVGDISNHQPHSWSKSGIMIRSGLETNAGYFGLYVTGGNGVCFQSRRTTGSYPVHYGCKSDIPEAWLKVEKRIDQYTSYYKTEATGDWIEVFSIELPGVTEGDSFQVGLAVSSVHWYPQEVVFSGYSVDSYFFPSMAPTISASPTSGSAIGELAEASQSTTCYGGVASRAIDGGDRYDWQGGSVMHTCNENDPWWMVDLGEDYMHINAVSVYNRGDCCQNRLGNTFLEVLDKDGNEVASKPFEGVESVYRFNFGNVVGRFVKVSKKQYGELNIAEVKVSGFGASPPS